MMGKGTIKFFSSGMLIVMFLAGFFCADAKGVINFTNLDFTGNDNIQLNTWNFDFDNNFLSMNQSISNFGPAESRFSYVIDGSTTVTFFKSIVNDTDETLTGYKFKINEGKGKFVDIFGNNENITVTDDTLIFEGSEIAPGESFTVEFDVFVTNPEPASIVLFSVSGLLLRKHSKKK